MRNGNINERGPVVLTPALGVVTITHASNPDDPGLHDITVDMTPNQAIELGRRLIDVGEWLNYDISMAGDD